MRGLVGVVGVVIGFVWVCWSLVLGEDVNRSDVETGSMTENEEEVVSMWGADVGSDEGWSEAVCAVQQEEGGSGSREFLAMLYQAVVVDPTEGILVEDREPTSLFMLEELEGLPDSERPEIHSHGGSCEDREKMDAVRRMAKWAWDGYREYAFGSDELAPLSRRGVEGFGGCTGVMILDSLDTLFLLDLMEDFNEAKDWVNRSLDFACLKGDVSVFETTIRSFGGLLSSYYLTGETIFLRKSEELANFLIAAFGSSEDGRWLLPVQSCPLGSRHCRFPVLATNLAEVGSLTVEWRAFSRISNLTTAEVGRRAAEYIVRLLISALPRDRLPANDIIYQKDHYTFSGHASVSARADSFYEYLLKVYLQGGRGKNEMVYFEAFRKEMNLMILNNVVGDDQLPYRLTHFPVPLNTKDQHMDHLACFTAGILALGAFAKGYACTRFTFHTVC